VPGISAAPRLECVAPKSNHVVSARAPAPAAAEAQPASQRREAGTALAADAAALALRAALDRVVAPLARAACGFVRQRGWTEFGHARLDDHARERFGRSGRWVRDLAALGEAIDASPSLGAALTGADGGRPLGRVAAVLIARSKKPDATMAWIRYARRESVRDLRAALQRGLAERERTDANDSAGVATGPDGSSDGIEATVAGEYPDGDRVLFRLPLPLPVRVAFDEALDLYRAVEGRDASVTAFVEALTGEARATRPLDTAPFVSPLIHGRDQKAIEGGLRRSSAAWVSLPPPAAGTGDVDLEDIGESLIRFGDVEKTAGHGDAPALDGQIRALIALENEIESRLSTLLVEMGDRGLWATLMFASVGHYAEERLGVSRSRAGDRVRLARALRGLPRLAAACSSGVVSAEAAAIVHRLIDGAHVDARTEEDWIRHAAATTVKRLREEARAMGHGCLRRDGARGMGSRDPAAARPLNEEAWQASLRREAGTATERILALGRRAAGRDREAGPNEASGLDRAAAPDHVAAPDHATLTGAPPAPDVFQLLPAEPDVFLALRLPGGVATDFVAAIDAARSDLEAAAASTPWDEPWCVADPSPAQLIARIEFIRGRRLQAWVGLLAMLEDFAVTWDQDAGAPVGRDDAIFMRDGWRCAAPGCTSRRHLEDHHVVYRSRGGGHGHDNRVTLCRFHHQRGEHGGLMSVRGTAPLGLTWRLGAPDVATRYRNERRMDAP
jgi:uncharacterized protein DUF222